jgi:hypothetical protein
VSIGLTIVLGAAVVALLLIMFPPWRRVRDEKPLPPDVEAQVLLGEPPEQIATGDGGARRRPDRPTPPQAS